MKSAAPKLTLKQQEDLNQILLKAAEFGEVKDENGVTQTVSDLLDLGADVNASDANGRTALNLALYTRNKTTALVLLAHPKLEINKVNPLNSNTPALHQVVNADLWPEKKEVVSAFLKHPNIDVNITRDSSTALHDAVSNVQTEGHAEIALTILAHPDIAVNALTSGGRTALQMASSSAANILTDTHGGQVASPVQMAAIQSFKEITNKIITSTIASKRNEGADWQFMMQPSQLGSPKVQKLLDRKTATLLAVILPEGDLRDLTLKNFDERNPEAPLNQESDGAIANLKELRALLVVGFSKLKNCPANETSANIAIQAIVMNSDGLKSVRNYQESEKVLKRGLAVDEENPIGWIMNNPKLDVAQNKVFEKALQVLIKGPKTPPTTIKKSSSKKVDQTSGCCVIS